MKAGILYIVPTPVGNLADMTYRAVEVLRSVDLILAEDTRTSSILLQHYGIEGRVLSHHKFNEHQTSAQIKKQILEEGLSVALISDAGKTEELIRRLTRLSSGKGMCRRRHRGADSAGRYCLHSGHSVFRIALRQILFRGLPPSEKRQVHPSRSA